MGERGKGADPCAFQSLSSTRNCRLQNFEQTHRSVPSPHGREGKGSRSLRFSKPEFDSELQVAEFRTNTSISPLSPWERVRVRGGSNYPRVFNALRNAINNFTMSCGSSRCGTFTSAIFLFLVMVRPGSLAKSCASLEGDSEKKILPTAQRKIVVFRRHSKCGG